MNKKSSLGFLFCDQLQSFDKKNRGVKFFLFFYGRLCDLDTRRVMMSEIQQFSQHDIEVLNEETVYKGFLHLRKYCSNTSFLPVAKVVS